jgi:hypothetical protein
VSSLSADRLPLEADNEIVADWRFFDTSFSLESVNLSGKRERLNLRKKGSEHYFNVDVSLDEKIADVVAFLRQTDNLGKGEILISPLCHAAYDAGDVIYNFDLSQVDQVTVSAQDPAPLPLPALTERCPPPPPPLVRLDVKPPTVGKPPPMFNPPAVDKQSAFYRPPPMCSATPDSVPLQPTATPRGGMPEPGQVTAMGFSQTKAESALRQCRYDVSYAVNKIFTDREECAESQQAALKRVAPSGAESRTQQSRRNWSNTHQASRPL